MQGKPALKSLLILLHLLGLCLNFTVAVWTTSFAVSGDYYIQTLNNSFYKTSLATSTLKNASLSLNIVGTSLKLLKSPPSGSSIVRTDDNSIYALYGSCGTKWQISQYSLSQNAWTEISTLHSSAPDYHQGSILFANDNHVYIFGGSCLNRSDDVATFYNTLTAFSSDSHNFSSPLNMNPPVALQDASVVVIQNEAILFGGLAAKGWIGMNQLAIWQSSSWSYKSVTGSSFIDSRTGAITAVSVNNSKVVINGGFVDGRVASPSMAVLEMGVNKWSWNQPTASSYPVLQGAVMLPGDVLLGISNNTQPQVILLNITSWSYLKSYDLSTLTQAIAAAQTTTTTQTSISTTNSKQLTKGSIAAISTSSSVAGIVIVATLVAYLIRRRARRRPLGPLTPESDQGKFFPSPYLNDKDDHCVDSDAASTTTWEERRREFIQNYSGITNDHDDDKLKNNQKEVMETDNDSTKTIFGFKRKSLQSLTRGSKWTSSLTGDRRSTASSSDSSNFRRRSSGPINGLGIASTESEKSIPDENDNTDDDIYKLFKDREVQVLVSTTRKGKLRITNPDDHIDEDGNVQKVSDENVSRKSSVASKTRWLIGGSSTTPEQNQ
ncbi:hypothetical protein V1514DRAFT_326834 [Lipomyces japonicus]|uniref:uncharacterized protein n=1 Tax=Lipomyces japonicus TaxID=56871 RepID=UPI0034CD2CF7